MTVIKKMLEATTNFIKSRALKNIVPVIAHMHAWAGEGNPCHAQPPTHLNGQSLSTKSTILLVMRRAGGRRHATCPLGRASLARATRPTPQLLRVPGLDAMAWSAIQRICLPGRLLVKMARVTRQLLWRAQPSHARCLICDIRSEVDCLCHLDWLMRMLCILCMVALSGGFM